MSQARLVLVASILASLVVGGLAAAWRLDKSRTWQLFGRLVAQVDTRDSIVALTFDDGPAPIAAEALLATLSARSVHATFFVTGRAVEEFPAIAVHLVNAGHELGNHSYSHERMLLMRPQRIRHEIERTDSLIRAVGQVGPIYFRPPYGDKLVGLPWFLARTDRTTVMWSIEPDSYADVAANKEQIVRFVLSHVRPGSIIILHPWYPSRRTSLAAVGPMIDSLQAHGYRVASVREVLRRVHAGDAF